MKKQLTVATLLTITFFVGIRTERAISQQQPTPKASCTVPKSYGEFKGMSGSAFIFEGDDGTIKTLTCETNNLWTPQIQILRK
ncbi:MAG TPA: hypothetical protein VK722_04740 [Candidatus Aquilonibacter sp.]|jgi:hypothetical protein|nr:hypothetical protein [Candidatus Aquilonibacter sp.]